MTPSHRILLMILLFRYMVLWHRPQAGYSVLVRQQRHYRYTSLHNHYRCHQSYQRRIVSEYWSSRHMRICLCYDHSIPPSYRQITGRLYRRHRLLLSGSIFGPRWSLWSLSHNNNWILIGQSYRRKDQWLVMLAHPNYLPHYRCSRVHQCYTPSSWLDYETYMTQDATGPQKSNHLFHTPYCQQILLQEFL